MTPTAFVLGALLGSLGYFPRIILGHLIGRAHGDGGGWGRFFLAWGATALAAFTGAALGRLLPDSRWMPPETWLLLPPAWVLLLRYVYGVRWRQAAPLGLLVPVVAALVWLPLPLAGLTMSGAARGGSISALRAFIAPAAVGLIAVLAWAAFLRTRPRAGRQAA